ncbi:MAG: Nif3-like dinuclear metal center hexameric protein [Coriobacteriia bacterium]|nr:Nif3-like dinuclear metal center hexameric protein [Coriobacteriia bacterium]
MNKVVVGDIERAIAKAFPPEWAEDWDRVGLLAGDPERQVTGVTLALDPTQSAIRATAAAGDNVLLTHHPAFLKTPNWLTPGRGSAGVLFSAMDSGVALVNAHTNLDRAPGAGELLPSALGLTPIKPIERSLMPMSLVTVFVPHTHVQRVIDAMTGAGAGRVGEYEGASFASAPGSATFTPGPSSSPFVGEPGQPASAQEVRIEMVAPRAKARGVVGAARGAHPYEEPLIVAADVTIARSSARMGMLSRAPEGLTLAGLATLAAGTFNITPRIWGEQEALVARVATATGSAGSLVGDVVACGATALVAGEVRYHDALDAMESGLAIVELGHDVSEWPLVALLKDAILRLPGLDPATVHVLPATPGWWTP